MKNKLLVFITLFFAPILASCTSISFQQIYPHHYEIFTKKKDSLNDLNQEGKTSKTNLPPGLIEVLPYDFQLAHITGYLICVFDKSGQISFPEDTFNFPNDSRDKIYFIQQGEEARKHRKSMLEKNYKIYEPIAYPNVACFKPNLDFEEIINSKYLFEDWGYFLSKWQDKVKKNDDADDKNKNLVKENMTTGALISKLEEQIASAKKESNKLEISEGKQRNDTAKLREDIKKIEIKIIELDRDSFNLFILSSLDISTRDKKPVFNPEIEYSMKRDFGIPVLENNLEKLHDETGKLPKWVNFDSNAPPYMSPFLASRFEEAYKVLGNPETYAPDLAKEILDSKITQDNFKVISGARTIWRQHCLKKEKPPNGTPTANYLDSGHAIGLYGDINMRGTPFDVAPIREKAGETKDQYEKRIKNNTSAYNTLLKILDKVGLHAPLGMTDPNHFTIINPTPTESKAIYESRIKMFKDYEIQADLEMEIEEMRAVSTQNFNSYLLSYTNALDNNLQTKLAEAQNSLLDLKMKQAKFDEAEKEKNSLIDKKNGKLEELREKTVEKLNELINNLQNKIKDQNKTIEDLQKKLADSESTKKELDQAKEHLENLKNELNKALIGQLSINKYSNPADSRPHIDRDIRHPIRERNDSDIGQPERTNQFEIPRSPEENFHDLIKLERALSDRYKPVPLP